LGNRYSDICDTVVKLKEHKDALVRRSVIILIPLLAQFDPTAFASTYLSTCMTYLISQLKKDKERSPGTFHTHTHPSCGTGFISIISLLSTSLNVAFVAIGSVAIAMGSNISPYLEQILVNIKEGLTPKG